MRTLSEIIKHAKDGAMPSHEECYWAMLCYNSMFALDHRVLREVLLAEKQPNDLIRKLKADNSFTMYTTALSKSPKDYLGPSNDPSNPEYQKFRNIGKKIVDRVIAKGGHANDNT